jgi:SNF2 family DNA or RNA helicase
MVSHVITELQLEINALNPDFVYNYSSTKSNKIAEIVKEIKEKHPAEKTVIFSQSRGFLLILEKLLEPSSVAFLSKASNPTTQSKVFDEFNASAQMVTEDCILTSQNILLVHLRPQHRLDISLSRAKHVIIADSWDRESLISNV